MVNLFDPYVVGVEALHHPGQPAVEAEHQVDAQAVVRGVEERTAFFPAIAAQLLQTICPARRAADDRNPCVDARPDVAVGRVGVVNSSATSMPARCAASSSDAFASSMTAPIRCPLSRSIFRFHGPFCRVR